MTAIEELKAEHQAVLLTISILDQITSKLEAGQAIDLGHLDQILEFLRFSSTNATMVRRKKFFSPPWKRLVFLGRVVQSG
ncbi:hypothetical protein SBF1_450006 [Candidatus Desulfosporosinus infrequens]|uniref:Uncharacterized protein n=1 Tax=Candidatus Desulfosporosinus infrequens TaxID=2043169 RepID=A0A2U3LBR0_9FIRM|nr:hypothetical protein SBF1_450006 [Candidatus Desulfosporosinus infrequens]